MSTAYAEVVDLGPWPFIATAVVGIAVVAAIVLLAVRARRRS